MITFDTILDTAFEEIELVVATDQMRRLDELSLRLDAIERELGAFIESKATMCQDGEDRT